MSRLKGATLVCCEACGAEDLEVEWAPQTGWVCASCEMPINGDRPPSRGFGLDEEQLDLF